MATGPAHAATKHVERLFTAGTVAGMSEEQLLDRFVARRDDAAFEALVARHGPMVLTVCRRLLRDPNDVDDAFQATFLVLVRKAGVLRKRELLGNWLYGVAWRVALRARGIASRRSRQPASALEQLPAGDNADPSAEPRVWLHEEVGRLPEKYRTAVVVCYLEGLTHDEAARRLGWPVGTVKGRLSRARELLRTRLLRRGLTAGCALTVLGDLPREASAAVPATLSESTLRTVTCWGSVPAAGLVAGPVLGLTEGVMSAMFLAKLKSVGIVTLVAAGVVMTGVGVGAFQFPEGRKNPAGAAGAPAAPGADQNAVKDAKKAAVGTPSAPVSAQDVLNAEKSTFQRLLGANGPGSLSRVMNLHDWSERVLRAHLDATADPALRAAALAAHAARMEALATNEDGFLQANPGRDGAAAVAQTYAQAARYRLASAQPNPPAAGIGGEIGIAGGMGMLGGGMGMAGGGMGMGMVDERFAGRTSREAELLAKVIAQSEVRREIATLSARIKDPSPVNSKILKKLGVPVSMSFRDATPFEDVLKFIKSATQGDNDSGIAIYVDPEGLELAEKTMQSPVTIDLEGIPLKVTLRLLLRQIGLAYCVKDGLLLISTPEIVLEELKEAEELLGDEGTKS